jgi:hypothetical protein
MTNTKSKKKIIDDDIYELDDDCDESSSRWGFRTSVQGTRTEDLMRFFTKACYQGFDDSKTVC